MIGGQAQGLPLLRNMVGRRSIRIKDYDYSQAGAYFLTICAVNRKPLFALNPELKHIIRQQWLNLEHRFNNVILDDFVIMPDHLHGIILLTGNSVGATLAVARNDRRAGTRSLSQKAAFFLVSGEVFGFLRAV